MFNPWDPQGGEPPPEAAIPPFLEDPRIRAAMLQTGLALMQPPSFGDNFTSQFGRAIGSGGEAAQRMAVENRAQTEAASRQDLRGAQAEAAGARAETAGARSDTAASRLALERLKMEALNDRNRISGRIRLQNAYNAWVKNINAENSLKPAGQQTQVPDFQTWLSQRDPELVKALQLSGGGTGQGAGAVDETVDEGVHPPAPRNAADRVEGMTYQGANGPVKWLGGKWVRP